MKNDMIFGIHPVIEALDSGKEIDKIFIQNGLLSENIKELKATLKQHEIHVHYVPIEKLNRLTKKNHQGVVAFISPISFYKIENLLPTIYEEGKIPFILILDRLTDIRNLGAITRTAECVGVDAIIIGDKQAAPINSDAIKTSAGAIFNINICKTSHLPDTIDYLKNSGLKIVSATEKATSLVYEEDLNTPIALVMGSEENGISKSILEKSDVKVKLPIFGKTGSLNVSVACGSILYEIVRQKL